MSSPRNSGPVREGNRVVLREITATLHNSSPLQTLRRKSGSDNSTPKAAEHEVKVQFAREFADVESITWSAPQSVSSASSIPSFASAKSSTAAYASPFSGSPLNNSYVNSNISGLDDLINGCARLQLNDDRSFDSSQKSVDLSQNQIFASATDELEFHVTHGDREDSVKEVFKNDSTTHDSTCSPNNSVKNIKEHSISSTAVCVKEPLPVLASSGRRSSFIQLEIKLSDVVENSESPERNNDLYSNKTKTDNSLVFDDENLVASNSNESLSKKNVDHLGKAGAVNSKRQEESKEFIEDNSDSWELKVSPDDFQDVFLKSEVAGVEQHSESKLEKQNTSLSRLNIEQSNPEELKTGVIEQVVNVAKSHIPLESDVSKIEEQFKQQEGNTSLTTLNIEKSNPEELKTVSIDQILNKSDAINLEKISLTSEVPRVEQHSQFESQEQINSWDTLDIKQPSFKELEAAATEQIRRLDSSINLEVFRNVSLDGAELEVEEFAELKLEEENNSLSIEQPISEELKFGTAEQVVNKLDSIDLEKFHNGSLKEFTESKPETQSTSLGIGEPEEELKDQIADKLSSTIILSESQDVPLDSEEREEIEQYIEFKQNPSPTTLGIEQLTPKALEVKQIASKSDSNINLDKTHNVSLNSPVTPKADLKSQRQSTSLSALDTEQSSFEESKTAEVTNKLNTTTDLNDYQDARSKSEVTKNIEHYTEFKPQRQSTSLATFGIVQPDFEELKAAAAEQVANDIANSTQGLIENTTDCFVSATSEIFQDPTSFDFLMNHGKSQAVNLRTESLYIKFDPLVSQTEMLPQGNTQPIDDEQNEKSESIPADINTPKRNPAIAAIDRLLFYSPLSTSMTQKADETQEKVANKEQPTEEPKANTPLINDINMSKELELVRATVLQLEEELEKQKKEYEAELEKQQKEYEAQLEKQQKEYEAQLEKQQKEYEAQLEKQQKEYEAQLEKQQEKINKMQAQVAQEVKSKSQMTVVVEEYEKSISRLLTERERDRTNFEQEKVKLQEEVQSTNVHLANMEAAFSDFHQKYEKMKGVVSAYKNNETVLKESIQENLETIKGLEMRYQQLKNHAMSQLEKANYELDAMRKQHEDETVTLHAMVRKAELKSNSLAELVEQKTKENKELTQILDEVIARVGHQNAE